MARLVRTALRSALVAATALLAGGCCFSDIGCPPEVEWYAPLERADDRPVLVQVCYEGNCGMAEAPDDSSCVDAVAGGLPAPFVQVCVHRDGFTGYVFYTGGEGNETPDDGDRLEVRVQDADGVVLFDEVALLEFGRPTGDPCYAKCPDVAHPFQ